MFFSDSVRGGGGVEGVGGEGGGGLRENIPKYFCNSCLI